MYLNKSNIPPKWSEFTANHDSFLNTQNPEAWVQSQLRMSASQYTETRDIRIATCSWNVNQVKVCKSIHMRDWLQLQGDHKPDIIAIGLQVRCAKAPLISPTL